MSIDQTHQWEAESLRYVKSYLDSPATVIADLLEPLKEQKIASICDIGCGNGKNLVLLSELFGCAGVGIEPSVDAVTLLKAAHGSTPKLSFERAFAHRLPFPSDRFDLVVCWSVLHWIGRNEYLQSLGEMVRVTRRFLLVMDFVASEDYRTPYAHRNGFYTYKMNFDSVLGAAGTLRPLFQRRWWIAGDNRPEYMDAGDLVPFAANPLNWHSRMGVVYEKDASVLPYWPRAHFER